MLNVCSLGFKFCRSNDKRRGDMCASLNGPEAPAGIEPAVEKGTLAASWTFLQSEACPWYSSVRAQYGYGTVCVCARVLSHIPLFATPWTIAHKAALSMEISRQEYWSGLPFPSPEDLPSPGIKPMSLVSLAVAGWFFTTVSPGHPCGTLGQLIDSMTVFVTDESNQLSTSPNLKASLLNSLMGVWYCCCCC